MGLQATLRVGRTPCAHVRSRPQIHPPPVNTIFEIIQQNAAYRIPFNPEDLHLDPESYFIFCESR